MMRRRMGERSYAAYAAKCLMEGRVEEIGICAWQGCPVMIGLAGEWRESASADEGVMIRDLEEVKG
eukprot:1160886-Pelagomonas_calceolata.AAC.1